MDEQVDDVLKKMNNKKFAIDLAKQAGVIMLKHFSDDITKDWKKDSTPVTIADKEINELVVKAVTKNYPEYGLLAEEGGSNYIDQEYVWVCDPIDGTLPYSHAIPTATFSLALVRNGDPVLGILFDPFMNRAYFAEKGQGAMLNDKKIQVMKDTNLSGKVVGTVSWPGAPYNLMGFYNELFKLDVYPINMVVTTYPGMLVASGQLIANVFYGSSPWDTAAQKIIIEEAGGKVTDLKGNEQRYDQPTIGILASNGQVHDSLLDILINKA